MRQNHDSVWDFSCGQSEGADFLAQHTLLQVCHPLASLLEKSRTIIAWQGVWECSVAERIDVRQNHDSVWDFSCGQGEGADFLAQHTLLQVYHPLASMLEKGTTIIAWQGVWE